MRSFFFTLATVAVFTAQYAHASPTAVTCSDMASTYDRLSKVIADEEMSDIGDDSAPRATLRQLKINNAYSQGAQILTIMANRKCPLPENPMTPAYYFNDALTCATQRLTDVKAPACDYSKWVPTLPK